MTTSEDIKEEKYARIGWDEKSPPPKKKQQTNLRIQIEEMTQNILVKKGET